MSAQVETDSTMLALARAARARGWRPIPLDHPHAHGDAVDEDGEPTGCTGKHDRIPCDGERGKHPCGGWGAQSRSEPTDGMLQIWFGNDPRNIGIACGPSGLVVLDEDELGALERLAAEYGEMLPATYRVRTRRGWHWYFRPPAGRVVGNAPGRLKDHHIDVRGGAGHGGYVVGAGSVHQSGHVYAAEDADAAIVEIPGWILDLIDDVGEGEPREGWTDDVRFGSETELIEQFEHRCELVRTPGFRYSLFNAARDGWRLVHAGVLSEHEMLAQLRDVVVRVWGAPPDRRDKRIVYDEARAAAEQSPWEVIPQPQEIGEHGDYVRDGPAEERRLEREADAGDDDAAEELAYRRLKARRAAERRLAAEERPALRVLDFEEFLSSPIPEYLVPGMLYRDGLATVFGPPGSAKSFLMLDIALCIATNRPWRGREMPRGKVHYVMAEGQAVNTLRSLAWLHFHGVDRSEAKGWFRTIPEGVVLTPAGIASYLPLVVEDQPDLIILDTKNLMYEGKESAGEDLGAMVRVLHKLRQAAGGCAVVLIDHTGLSDDTRVRGGNAQKGGMGTEVRVIELESGLREASITRDKSGMIGQSWLYRLQSVPEVPVPPDMAAPAVCVPAETGGESLGIHQFSTWNDPGQPQVPMDVVDYKGTGRAAVVAVARFMRHNATEGIGMTMVQCRRAVAQVYVNEKGKPRWSEDTIDRAWGALHDLGRLEPDVGQQATGRCFWQVRPGDPA